MSQGQVLFEFTQVGQMMRVAAIDETTGIEVVVIAPVNAAKGHMQRLAMAKLRKKLETTATAPLPTRGKLA